MTVMFLVAGDLQFVDEQYLYAMHSDLQTTLGNDVSSAADGETE